MVDNGKTPIYHDPDTFDFRGSIRSLMQAARDHKLIVATSCVLCLGLATAYLLLFPPIFVATARVMVEQAVDNSRDSFYTQWDVFRKDDPRTEMELMTAPGLIAKVVRKEGLDYDSVYHPFPSHLSYLWRTSAPGRAYHRIKDSLFPKKPDPDAPSKADIELARTVTDMQKGVKIAPVADSNIGELTLRGPSRRVAKIANTLLETYMAERAARYQQEAQRNLDALDKEVDLASREAREIADRRLEFLKTNMLTFDFAKESQQLTKLVDLEDSIAANRAKAATLEASLQYIERQLSAEPPSRPSAFTMETNPVREAARIKRLELETGLNSLRSIYREDSPEVQEVLHNIAQLDKIIASEPEKMEKTATSTLNSTRQELILSRNTLRSQLEGVRGGLAVMEEHNRALRARMNLVPELQNQLREYDRQYSLVLDRYQALSAKRAQAAVSRAMAGAATPSMQVVQWASSPDEPAWPKVKVLYPSALVLGLILGFIGAQIRSLASGRVRRADLEGPQSNMIYGTIRIPIGSRPFTVAAGRRSSGSRESEY